MPPPGRSPERARLNHSHVPRPTRRSIGRGWAGPAFVAAGERYSVDNPGPEELHVVSVTAPADEQGLRRERKVIVRFADREPLPATAGREFRYLVNQDAGCRDMTQFLGVIPPS